MLLSFANREGTHQRAYALLNDTLGLEEKEYSVFLDYEEMRSKIEFMTEAPKGLLMKLIWHLKWLVLFAMRVWACFVFVMLLNFQRFGKMKGCARS